MEEQDVHKVWRKWVQDEAPTFRVAELRPGDWTDLHWAVWCQDLESVKTLLSLDKSSIDAHDSQGWTCLHLACSSAKSRLWRSHQVERRVQSIRSTLSTRSLAVRNYLKFANSNLVNNRDGIDEAEEGISFMIAMDLLHSGADYRTETRDFVTPLHCAGSSGWAEHIDMLLYCGASMLSERGCSPICWTLNPTVHHQIALDYLKKKLGPDVWNRLQCRRYCNSGQKIPPFSPPTDHYWKWYNCKLKPYTLRPCLPGSWSAVKVEKPSPTCPLCTNITLTELSSQTGYLHASSLQVLLISSETCKFCRLMFDLLSRWHKMMGKDDVCQIILRSDTGGGSLHTIITLKLQLSGGCFCGERSLIYTQCQGNCQGLLMEDISFDIFASEYDFATAENLLTGRIPSRDSRSPELINVATGWLNSCNTAHERCQQSSEKRSHFIPSRLLDVSNTMMSDSIQLKGIHQQSVKYAAVSHRWVSGSTPSWVTTTSNLQERCRGLDMSTMPSSIQDAVTIIRALGIPYIWIDSLCILQDSLVDWRLESSKMLDIFGNATLTLFLDCAENDDDSFLKSRPNETFQNRRGIELSLRGKLGDSSSVYILERCSRYRFNQPAKSSAIFTDDVVNSHLSSRGWILQEQVISPRRLHFGHRQIYWICEQSSEAEDGTSLTSAIPGWLRWLFTRPNIPTQVVEDKTFLRNHRDWAMFVENYTDRSLTKREDRVVAISSLAKRFGDVFGDDYVCGCWRSVLEYNMMWTLKPVDLTYDRVSDKLETSQEYPSASTWSWLSTEGAVIFPYLREFDIREIKLHYSVIDSEDLNPAAGGGEFNDSDKFTTLLPYPLAIIVNGFLQQASTRGRSHSLESDPRFAPHWLSASKDLSSQVTATYDQHDKFIGYMVPDRPGEEQSADLYLLALFQSFGKSACCNATHATGRHFLALKWFYNSDGMEVFKRVGYGWSANAERQKDGGEPWHEYTHSPEYEMRWRSESQIFAIV